MGQGPPRVVAQGPRVQACPPGINVAANAPDWARIGSI